MDRMTDFVPPKNPTPPCIASFGPTTLRYCQRLLNVRDTCPFPYLSTQYTQRLAGTEPFRSRAHSLPGANRPIGPWPIRSLELLLLGPFSPWPFRSLAFSLPGTFTPRSEMARELSFPGTFALKSIRSQEHSLPGTVVSCKSVSLSVTFTYIVMI